jgi:bacterioferritin-associated ferredoxin
MIVCLCANVSERELAETITAGATTVKEVGRVVAPEPDAAPASR